MSPNQQALTFDLPLPPNRANKPGAHWSVRHGRRKKYWAVLDLLVTAKQNPRCIPGMPWAKAEAEVQVRTWRKADIDNCHARCKDVFDWLESRGYIVNDRELRYQLVAVTAPQKLLGITLTLREAA